jgi:hypothetical protein
MRIRDWTFIEIPHQLASPMMYVHHHCPGNYGRDVVAGNITRCNVCQLEVPDDIRGLLTMYNWDHEGWEDSKIQEMVNV